MKKIAALFATACLAMANPAMAASFSPPGATFTATGQTSLTAAGFLRLNCTATFKGKVNANGTGTVTSATFVGGTLGACSGVRVTVPFTLTANSTTSVTVNNIQVTAPIACGPGNLSATWTNGSPSHFDIPTAALNPGGCTVTAALTVAGITII